jgi:hypothetical protein
MTQLPFPLAFAALAVAAALNGCATTGTGGSDITGVSAADAQPSSAIEGTCVVSSGAALPHPEDPSALRVPARVMRIWIAPWEDSRGDLHAPGYLYTEIEPRRWALDARDDHTPVIRPLQIERCDAPTNAARPSRDAGATRTPGRTKGPDSGAGLLGS